MDLNLKEKLTEFFPIGTKYSAYRDRTDRCWEKDFTNMKTCGMNMTRIHCTWGTIEPDEGRFEFDYYDRILESAVSHGLKVLFTLYLVCAPQWAFEKHADSCYVSMNGTKWSAEQCADACTGGWPGLCFDSRPYRKTVENFIKAVTEHYKGNTDIIGFDVIHEPTEEPAQQYWQNDWHEMIYCHCEHSKNEFRKWLENKYGSLERLNEVWTRQYQRWDQVQPPKNVGMYTDWMDWKYFRSDAQNDMVSFISSTVKKYDETRATVVHTAIYETAHPIVSSNDHFKLANATDMLGTSLYDMDHPEMTAFICDLMRSAADNGPYWAAETGSGGGPMFLYAGEKPEDAVCFSRSISGDEIKLQSWGQIARGAKGIVYWGWRPELSTIETACLGFAERNGDLNERTEALKEFTDIFYKNKSRLVKAFARRSDAAILYNLDTVFIEGLVSLGISGSSAIRPEKRFYKDTISILGAYRLCMKNCIQPDFVDKNQVLDGALDNYRLLILPFSVSITTDLAEKIRLFVEKGGKVIAEGMCGYFTDDAWGAEVCPAGGLDEVFGLHINSHYDLIDTKSIDVGNRHYSDVVKAISERIHVHDGAGVIGCFDDESPALVVNRYGLGSTIYTGALYFANCTWNPSEDTDEFFKELLKSVGYVPDSSLKGEGYFEVRKLYDDEGAFIFILNHSNIAEKFDADISVGIDAKAVEELIDGDSSGCLVENGRLKVKGEIGPKGVKIFKVS